MYTVCSPGKRILAWFLDMLLVGVMTYVISLILNTFLGIPIFDSSMFFDAEIAAEMGEPTIVYLGSMISNLIISPIIYFVVIPVIWEGQTVGRIIMKLKVVKENNEKATLGDFFIRDYIGANIVTPILIGLCCIGLIINAVFCFGEKNTIISDIMARTKLVEIDSYVPVEEEVNVLSSEDDIVKFEL